MSSSSIVGTSAVPSAVKTPANPTLMHNGHSQEHALLAKARKPSDLQLKLESQLKKSRNVVRVASQDRSLMHVASSSKGNRAASFVSLTDSSEDELDDVIVRSPDVVIKQPVIGETALRSNLTPPAKCTDKLLGEGYWEDDLTDDDEDLNLVPPRQSRSAWCHCSDLSCVVQ